MTIAFQVYRGRILMTSIAEHDQFPSREDKQEKLEVHVASVCIQMISRRPQVLAARRTANRSLYPGKWECGGGMVRPGESFDTAIQRQIFEEFGLEIERVRVLEVYEIPLPKNRRQSIIPGVRFLCLAKAGKVRLNKREFSTFRWVDLRVDNSLDWIGGIKEMLDDVAGLLGQNVPQEIKRLTRRIGFGRDVPPPEPVC
jgi:8-oxo-dGTP pyrophosphatase MutT (NUDIX family)